MRYEYCVLLSFIGVGPVHQEDPPFAMVQGAEVVSSDPVVAMNELGGQGYLLNSSVTVVLNPEQVMIVHCMSRATMVIE